jgi:hypothetical protein
MVRGVKYKGDLINYLESSANECMKVLFNELKWIENMFGVKNKITGFAFFFFPFFDFLTFCRFS